MKVGSLVYNIFDERKIDQREIGIIMDVRTVIGTAKVLWPGHSPSWIRKANLEMIDATE